MEELGFGSEIFDVFAEGSGSKRKHEDEAGPSKKRVKDVSDDDEGEVIEGLQAVRTESLRSKLQECKSIYGRVKPMKCLKLETLGKCQHEVVLPSGYNYIPLKANSGESAKKYPFPLDDFQKEAISCIDNHQSVLVSAHTSAGKTVPAEYSIALSLQKNQRIIYTTPIKALSNQKYREFSDEFKDVGLITGDVTINYEASCLIMTTEILRNMLFRGSEILREVAWVIFDEIHYMRDKERGVIWEETLILLPDNVRFVFLSATVPNARQFAEWVSYLHNQPCHVVSTDYRPVPLQHYVFPSGASGIYLIVDEHGNFRDDTFALAMSVTNADAKESRTFAQRKESAENSCYNIVKMLMERRMAPLLAFSFSKKECEAHAMKLVKLDFNTPEEKKLVDQIFENAMSVLSEEDRQLPQITQVIPLLRKGIGIHHGGLLPVLKETIEILFGEGLLKVLFATETFAMGLNMPARTVVFTSCRKFDGVAMRFLTSGEYIQMSGRAGRRGLDDKGIIILMADEKIGPEVCKDLVQGAADPLNSAFHMTYNMILNLMRVEDINPEYILEKSFLVFQNASSLPEVYGKIKTLEAEYDSLKVSDATDRDNGEELAKYCQLMGKWEELQEKIRAIKFEHKRVLPFLQPGRLVKVDLRHVQAWCVVLNFKRNVPRAKAGDGGDNWEPLAIHVLAPAKRTEDDKLTATLEVVSINPDSLLDMSTIRLNCPKDLTSKDNIEITGKLIQETIKRLKVLPSLDAKKDLKITDRYFDRLLEKVENLEEKMRASPLHAMGNIEEMKKAYKKKEDLRLKLESALEEIKKKDKEYLLEELKKHKRVLRKLNYCTEAEVIETKGKFACDLSCGDEILLTEMVFEGVFANLDVAQTVAILSCFVCDDRSNSTIRMTEELSAPLRKMKELAGKIARVSQESGLNVKEDDYVDKFKPYLMDVAYHWCKGVSFEELCRLTDIFEGGIVRMFRRLEEMLRMLQQATKSIGNKELEKKFTDSVVALKRGIIFSASLYL